MNKRRRSRHNKVRTFSRQTRQRHTKTRTRGCRVACCALHTTPLSVCLYVCMSVCLCVMQSELAPSVQSLQPDECDRLSTFFSEIANVREIRGRRAASSTFRLGTLTFWKTGGSLKLCVSSISSLYRSKGSKLEILRVRLASEPLDLRRRLSDLAFWKDLVAEKRAEVQCSLVVSGHEWVSITKFSFVITCSSLKFVQPQSGGDERGRR